MLFCPNGVGSFCRSDRWFCEVSGRTIGDQPRSVEADETFSKVELEAGRVWWSCDSTHDIQYVQSRRLFQRFFLASEWSATLLWARKVKQTYGLDQWCATTRSSNWIGLLDFAPVSLLAPTPRAPFPTQRCHSAKSQRHGIKSSRASACWSAATCHVATREPT